MLNLSRIFSCYSQNESGRLVMSTYYGIVFMFGETNCYSCGEGWKKNTYVMCAPQYCHQELL